MLKDIISVGQQGSLVSGDSFVFGTRKRGVFNPYSLILATEPEAFFGFEYKEINGVQVLFQNSAATIPVEEIGDPVGGYRDFETGGILAIQTTDANRPIWGGEGVGLVFVGNQSFTLSDHWKRQPNQATTWVYREEHPNDENQVLGAWSTSSNTDVAYAWYYRENNGLIQRVGTGGTRLVEGVIPHNTMNTFSVRNDTIDYTARINGSDIQTRSTEPALGDIDVPATLGSLEGVTQFFNGNILWAAIYDKSLGIETLGVLETT